MFIWILDVNVLFPTVNMAKGLGSYIPFDFLITCKPFACFK